MLLLLIFLDLLSSTKVAPPNCWPFLVFSEESALRNNKIKLFLQTLNGTAPKQPKRDIDTLAEGRKQGRKEERKKERSKEGRSERKQTRKKERKQASKQARKKRKEVRRKMSFSLSIRPFDPCLVFLSFLLPFN